MHDQTQQDRARKQRRRPPNPRGPKWRWPGGPARHERRRARLLLLPIQPHQALASRAAVGPNNQGSNRDARSSLSRPRLPSPSSTSTAPRCARDRQRARDARVSNMEVVGIPLGGRQDRSVPDGGVFWICDHVPLGWSWVRLHIAAASVERPRHSGTIPSHGLCSCLSTSRAPS